MVRHILATMMHDLLVADDDAAAVQLAVSEVCGNVVRHANKTEEYVVDVNFHADPPWCSITVEDRGAERGTATRNHDPLSDSGRGMLIIQSVMDVLRINVDVPGTVVELEKSLRVDPASMLTSPDPTPPWGVQLVTSDAAAH